jgi:hypothetical protein
MASGLRLTAWHDEAHHNGRSASAPTHRPATHQCFQHRSHPQRLPPREIEINGYLTDIVAVMTAIRE